AEDINDINDLDLSSYEKSGCHGYYNSYKFYQIRQVCEECDDLFKGAYRKCSENCFANDYFGACLYGLMKTDKREKFAKIVLELHHYPFNKNTQFLFKSYQK
ncbi:ion transport peptide-like isoform X3, partial [Dinothrombium tinctorium]